MTVKLPILLGVKNTPFNMTTWDQLCMEKLGRKVSFKERLTAHEWTELGYVTAGQELNRTHIRPRRERE
jgi:hypothetical protein